ncbi:hypothetical protein ACEQ8H_002549 [Pleosporales sp. CAS-2024a]
MYAHASPAFCYFTILVPSPSPSPSTAAHFSLETPTTSPVSEYSPHTAAEPSHPLLARRPPPTDAMSPDASRLLQLQTAVAHGPDPNPLHHTPAPAPTTSSESRFSSTASASSSRSSSSSSGSGSGTTLSPRVLSCCRCRRESLMGMIQFSTNIYYCSHCARMVGYSAG